MGIVPLLPSVPAYVEWRISLVVENAKNSNSLQKNVFWFPSPKAQSRSYKRSCKEITLFSWQQIFYGALSIREHENNFTFFKPVLAVPDALGTVTRQTRQALLKFSVRRPDILAPSIFYHSVNLSCSVVALNSYRTFRFYCRTGCPKQRWLAGHIKCLSSP